jgi:hypothetical protein
MEPLVICAVATGGLVGLFFVVLAWVMLTGVAPKRLKRFLVRYCVRGICLRTHNTLPWDESSVTCVVDEQVYMGMIPKQPEQLAALRKDQRVSALVTLNEVWEMPFYLAIAGIMEKNVAKPRGVLHGTSEEEDQLSSVSWCHLPTVDFNAPSLADIRKGVEWMQDHTAAGHSVYVHCNAGRGRSAVIVLCYLMATTGCTSREAYDLLASKRRIANLPTMCGTRPQWRAVKGYEKFLAKTREQPPVTADLTASQEGAAGVGLVPAVGRRANKVVPAP